MWYFATMTCVQSPRVSNNNGMIEFYGNITINWIPCTNTSAVVGTLFATRVLIQLLPAGSWVHVYKIPKKVRRVLNKSFIWTQNHESHMDSRVPGFARTPSQLYSEPGTSIGEFTA